MLFRIDLLFRSMRCGDVDSHSYTKTNTNSYTKAYSYSYTKTYPNKNPLGVEDYCGTEEPEKRALDQGRGE